MKVRVNILCLLGVAVGFLAMISVWRFVIQVGPMVPYTFLPNARIETGVSLFFDSLGQLQDLQMSAFYIAAMLAAVGVIAGIATPLGGVLEVAGACLFLSVTPVEEHVGMHGDSYYLRVGPFIALISGSLMVLSVVLPMVLNRGIPSGGLRGLLWTFAVSPQDGQTAPGHDGLLKTDLASWVPIRRSRAPTVFAAMAVAILVASVGLSLSDSYTRESAKMAILITVDTSEAWTYSVSLDSDRAFSIADWGSFYYYIDAGEHHILLEEISPWQNESMIEVYILPLQTVVVTVHITDEAWEISKT